MLDSGYFKRIKKIYTKKIPSTTKYRCKSKTKKSEITIKSSKEKKFFSKKFFIKYFFGFRTIIFDKRHFSLRHFNSIISRGTQENGWWINVRINCDAEPLILVELKKRKICMSGNDDVSLKVKGQRQTGQTKLLFDST